MLVRKTHLMDASVRQGGWLKAEGRTLGGLVAGVVGLGSIGRAIARRATAFGMPVVGHDIMPLSEAQQREAGARQVDLATLFATADVVFLACALTAENRHLIDERALAAMKDGVILVNVSRGPLVDEAALAAALASGRVGAAGLDVFEEEPLPAASPLRAFGERVTFSTHNGSNTREAVARINQMTTDILFDVLGLKPAGFAANRVA
jgi:D-3-phosphoglycerate dehydrogenase